MRKKHMPIPKVDKNSIIKGKKTTRKRDSDGRIDMDEYFEAIKSYLTIGYSLHMACKLGNVPYRTVIRYYKTSAKWHRSIEQVSSSVSQKARSNFVNAVNAGDIAASKEWLQEYDGMFRNKLDISGKLGIRKEGKDLDLTKLTDEELDRYEEIVKKATPTDDEDLEEEDK